MKSKKSTLKPWDRQDWPAHGDDNIDTTYQAVGRALSSWERLEGVLSLLFASLISGLEESAARRAYNAVRTFEARAEMLSAAAESYFKKHDDKIGKNKFNETLKEIRNYAARRNDIAHGVVDFFSTASFSSIGAGVSYCQYPSYANSKHRTDSDAPTYCYSSSELNYYSEKFTILQRPISELVGHLQFQRNNRTLRDKHPE
jgi:hypothetical protein